VHSATTFVVLLVFPEASQVGRGLLQRLCNLKVVKGEQGERVCCFEVVLFTFFFGLLNAFIYYVICYGSERQSCSGFASVGSGEFQEF
jgi:hypothetical protein